MAFYINMAIDCGDREEIADGIEAHFQEFNLVLPEIGRVECDVFKQSNYGHWFVGVWPIGMGYATHPVCRYELLPHEEGTRTALYQHLSKVGGYLRALFGAESFDTICCGAIEELSDIGYDHMVYSESQFPVPPSNCEVERFAEGYSMVVRRNGLWS